MPTNTFKNLTSSGIVIPGEGTLEGMYVNSTSSGILRLFNSPSAGTDTGKVIGGIMTPAAGYHYLGDIHATAGIYCGVQSGTINVTFHIRNID